MVQLCAPNSVPLCPTRVGAQEVLGFRAGTVTVGRADVPLADFVRAWDLTIGVPARDYPPPPSPSRERH